MRFLAGKEANTIWASAKKGAVVSPNKNVDLSVYPLLTSKEARQLTQATSFVFDGSDLAPPAVGGDAEFVALQRILKNPDKYMEALNYLEVLPRNAIDLNVYLGCHYSWRLIPGAIIAGAAWLRRSVPQGVWY